MSYLHLDLKSDLQNIFSFVQNKLILVIMLFCLQWITNVTLDKSLRPEMKLFQRLVVIMATTTLVFIGNQFFANSPIDQFLHKIIPNF